MIEHINYSIKITHFQEKEIDNAIKIISEFLYLFQKAIYKIIINLGKESNTNKVKKKKKIYCLHFRSNY